MWCSHTYSDLNHKFMSTPQIRITEVLSVPYICGKIPAGERLKLLILFYVLRIAGDKISSKFHIQTKIRPNPGYVKDERMTI